MSASISSAMISPEASAAEMSRREMQAKLNGLGGVGGAKLSEEDKAKKLRAACEGFESIFIQKMWQEMRNTIPKSGFMHGKEEKFWQDMYDQELSKSMTSAGGIGLADMMYEQLSRNLVSASRSAAAMSPVAAFTPAAAPLLPQMEKPADALAQDSPTSKPGAGSSIYDGAAPQAGDADLEDAKPGLMADAEKAITKPERRQSGPLEPAAAPVQAPAAPIAAQNLENEPREKPRKRVNRHYPSGPDLAQMAKRDAGDKLGPRAVRPPLRQQREEKEEKAAVQAEPAIAAAAPKPGSPEALRAALDLAKSGAPASAAQQAPDANPASPFNLNELAARVQANNAARVAMSAAGQNSAEAVSGAALTAQAAEDVQAEPVRRVTRFSTNIPKNGKNMKNSRQARDAIRMLNVDNVGVNSKAGKGLAAYHAAQEAAADAAQAKPAVAPASGHNSDEAAPQTQRAETPAAVIPPLSAPQAAKRDDDPAQNFAIPPLTAGETRS